MTTDQNGIAVLELDAGTYAAVDFPFARVTATLGPSGYLIV